MKVYVVTSYDVGGEDTIIHSVWDSRPKAESEGFRIAPDNFAVDITEFELNPRK